MSASLHALSESADRLRQLEEEARAERERRNQLIVGLVDNGEDRKAISRAGRVSPKSICVALKTSFAPA